MTRKEKIKQLLDDKRSFERDQELKQHQNYFILKSKVNRRLFDGLPHKSKALPHIDRRKS
jgi:hypothetical protein